MSAAWHLASRGVTGIVVVEQHEVGRGSSAKPMGGVRANFSDPMNVILGKRSLDSFRTWKEDFGTNIELAKVGYLFLARTEEEVANLEEATATQNELGVNSSMITPEKVAEVNPFIDPKAILAGSLSPDDGYACPAAASRATCARQSPLALRLWTTPKSGYFYLRRGDRISHYATRRHPHRAGAVRSRRMVCKDW